VSGEAEPLEQLLRYIEQRRREARHRLEDLTRRRAAVPRSDRAWAHETLRAEAAEAGNELARLNLLASLTATLLRDPASRAWPINRASSRRRPALGRQVASASTQPSLLQQDA
jgi:hypothetical protein